MSFHKSALVPMLACMIACTGSGSSDPLGAPPTDPSTSGDKPTAGHEKPPTHTGSGSHKNGGVQGGPHTGGFTAPVTGPMTGTDPVNDDPPTIPMGDPGDMAPPPPPTPPSPPPATSASTLMVSLSSMAPVVGLASAMTLKVTVAPMNGFSGPVTLAATGLPTDISGSFDTPTINIGQASAPAVSANLTLVTATNTASGSIPFTVTATSGAMVSQSASTLTVQSTITIHIYGQGAPDPSTPTNPLTSAFGNTILLNQADLPIVVNVENDDSTPHIIHADGDDGFFHGDIENPIQPGQLDSPRTVTEPGTIDFSLHDEPGGPQGEIIIQ